MGIVVWLRIALVCGRGIDPRQLVETGRASDLVPRASSKVCFSGSAPFVFRPNSQTWREPKLSSYVVSKIKGRYVQLAYVYLIEPRGPRRTRGV